MFTYIGVPIFCSNNALIICLRKHAKCKNPYNFCSVKVTILLIALCVYKVRTVLSGRTESYK